MPYPEDRMRFKRKGRAMRYLNFWRVQRAVETAHKSRIESQARVNVLQWQTQQEKCIHCGRELSFNPPF
jgi:hypothetical protein